MHCSKLISFDLQGTLSDSVFSDEFWLELLPKFYAEKHQITLLQAKDLLKQEFLSIGKYHTLFYNYRLRLDNLFTHWEFSSIVNQLQSRPCLDMDVLHIIKNIPANIPIILFSATTHDFIDIELANAKQYFYRLFSSIDDFQIPGKPSTLFQKIAEIMNVTSDNCLHIGDCVEMDYTNAIKAGWNSYYFDKHHDRQTKLVELKNVIHRFLGMNG